MGKLEGRCLCGAVTYASPAEPLFTAVCHCRDCQRQQGTAFAVVVGAPADGLDVEGELATYVTTGEEHGRPVHRRFCPTCGSPILSESEALPGVVVLKAGTLDDTSWLDPQLEVWGRSAQPWVGEAGARPRLDTGPRAPA